MTHQLNEAVYDDRRDIASTSRGYTRRSEADSTATRGDAARIGRLQSTSLGIEPLCCDPVVDRPSDMESNNTKMTSYAMMHVDLTDPSSVLHRTTDLEPASTSLPLLPHTIGPKQAPRGDDDEQHRIRSRSCSTATLDFNLERAAAQWGSSQDFGRNVQAIIDMLDEPSEFLSNSTTELIDLAKCTSSSANSAVLRGSDDSILLLESTLGELNRAIKTEKPQDAEKGSLLRPIKTEPSSPTLQSHRNTMLQPRRGGASAMCRRQLPRVGKWRAWNSIINFSAFDAMPGPLFTRHKKVIHSMTYDDIMRERAKKGAKRKGTGSGSGVVTC
jgi:hypothetical protein